MTVEPGGRPPFGRLLRELRLAAGLTQEALAERSQLSVDAIGALENGRRRRPHPDTLFRLADGLGLGASDRADLLAAARAPARARGRPPASRLPERPLVFISHTFDVQRHPEDRAFVAAAEAAAARARCRVSGGSGVAFEHADVYLAIVGCRSGTSDSRTSASRTEQQLEVVTARGLFGLVFLVGEKGPIGRAEPRAGLEALRRRVQDAGISTAWITSPAELELRLEGVLVGLRRGTETRPCPPDPCAGVPPEPSTHFVGRESELAELRRRLDQTGRLAVHGLGGVGKTQLVAQYVHQERGRYPDGVFWLRAGQEATLTDDLASLTWRLGLPEREEFQQQRQIAAVLCWLREHPRWVLVLDNLEPSTTEAARRWLPPGLPGHLLVTSRTPVWSSRLILRPLRLQVATGYLLERTGQADVEAAGTIARTLGCLPLAMEQAAAYLEGSGRDLAGYVELLRSRLIDLMRDGGPDGYAGSVATTWAVSFARIEQERPAAAALLRLSAFLDPDDIPVSVLQSHAGQLPGVLREALSDGVELDRTIATVRRYSMIERQGDSLRVHPLVQTVVRESLGVQSRRLWAGAVTRLLRAAFPDDAQHQPACWPRCARLLPHVQFVAQVAADADRLRLGWLLDRAALYLRTRGELRTAEILYERALAINQEVLGPEHPDTARSLRELGGLLAERGDLPAAAPLLSRAVAVQERALGPDHPDVANSLNDLAYVLRGRGEPELARGLLERALDIYERVMGPDHPETACGLNNLAYLLREQGQLDAARPLYERSLAIHEREMGPDHPDTALSLNNLGVLLRDQGDGAAARRLLVRSLTIRRRVLGLDHPKTARTLHYLGTVLRDQEEPAATPILERALAILEQELGADHPWTRECRDALLDREFTRAATASGDARGRARRSGARARSRSG